MEVQRLGVDSHHEEQPISPIGCQLPGGYALHL